MYLRISTDDRVTQAFCPRRSSDTHGGGHNSKGKPFTWIGRPGQHCGSPLSYWGRTSLGPSSTARWMPLASLDAHQQAGQTRHIVSTPAAPIKGPTPSRSRSIRFQIRPPKESTPPPAGPPMRWRRSAGPGIGQIPDSPAGFLESWRGYRGIRPRRTNHPESGGAAKPAGYRSRRSTGWESVRTYAPAFDRPRGARTGRPSGSRRIQQTLGS
jgi:hypothetical protein